MGKRELLRFLTLEELDDVEKEAGRKGRLLTAEDQRRCFVKQVLKTVGGAPKLLN